MRGVSLNTSVNPETRAFWDGATHGKLLLKKCVSCGEAHYYPRAICPFCFSDKTEWVEASGRGRIYSYSVARRVALPYAVAYVTLDEGPTLMTRIVECPVDELQIGQPVRLMFAELGGKRMPVFTPS
jgi:uncharacterized OB-fold protein